MIRHAPFIMSLVMAGHLNAIYADEPDKKEPVKLKLEDPKVFKDHVAAIQAKLFEAHSHINPSVRKKAVLTAKVPFDELIGKAVAFDTSIGLSKEEPFYVFASRRYIEAADGKGTITIDIHRNLFNGNGRETTSWNPKLTQGREIDKDKFDTIMGKESVECWGVVVQCNLGEDGKSCQIIVEGVISRDPFGVAVKRRNEISTDKSRWRGVLNYSDGTTERADFVFEKNDRVGWESRGDDAYVRGRGDATMFGEYTLSGDKLSVKLKEKTVERITEKAEFKAEFEGVLRNGFYVEGTFQKDRAVVRRFKEKDFHEYYTIDISSLKVESGKKGTFRLIKSDGD
jgi:hypothetical protein